MKDLGETSYILGIKIYRDRSKRMLGLSQSWYIDLILKRFNMEASKKGYLSVSYGIRLSKKICLKTSEERKRMNKILMLRLWDQLCMPCYVPGLM